jgi:hypothetical protein
VITNSYGNVVSSFFGAKFGKHIEELLVSPLPNWLIVRATCAAAWCAACWSAGGRDGDRAVLHPPARGTPGRRAVGRAADVGGVLRSRE